MKRITGKFITVILALLLTLGLLPVNAMAAEESDLQFGTLELYSSYVMGQKLADSYYYTDDWFFADSAERNDALALLSMQLTAAAVDGEEDGLGPAFLNELGFTETGYVSFDLSDFYGCSYTWGKKTITSGGESTTLVAVQIQSASFDKEVKKAGWIQNFTVNGNPIQDEHDALSKAAEIVLNDIAGFDGSNNVKYWITGQSRGGAIADLVAAHLPSATEVEGERIYAYTFEAPAVVESSAIADQSAYAYIHNYLCSNDIVTKIPMWGMTRYGNEYQLDTDETTAELPEELQKLGSDLYTVAEEAGESYWEGLIEKIMNTLNAGVATRTDYSEKKTDVFTDDNDSQISVSYVYQDILTKVMGIIFGEGIGEIDIDQLLSKADMILPAVISLMKAMKEESDKDYYAAALCIKDVLPQAGLDIPLTVEEFYALLKLAAPLVIDPEAYDPENEPESITEAIIYLVPVIELYSGVRFLTLSHHFESVIARLKVLAPAPELEDQDIQIEVPTAGDAVSKAPAEIMEWKEAKDASWMSIAAEWEGEGDVLEDNSIQYLDVTLTVAGHSIQENFSLTVNGTEPLEGPEIAYENGTYIVQASFAFAIGEAESVTVTFADPVHVDTPDPVKVPKGMKLKHALQLEDYGIVTDNEGTWRFNGWHEKSDDRPWKDITAKEDLTLYADWSQVINKVEISFKIPNLGEQFEMPSVPDREPYLIPATQGDEEKDAHVTDDSWDTVTTADTVGPFLLNAIILPKSEDIIFLTETDQWGGENYIGTAFVNGEEVKAVYDEEGGYLRIEYSFTAQPSAVYTIVEGDRVNWVKDTEEDLTVTVKRAEADETCFDHFRIVILDDTILGEDEYEAKAGSTIITLNAGILKYKEPGEETLRVFFDDGFAETTIVIKETAEEEPSEDPTEESSEKESPVKTGDRSQAGLWIILLSAAALTLLAAGAKARFGKK